MRGAVPSKSLRVLEPAARRSPSKWVGALGDSPPFGQASIAITLDTYSHKPKDVATGEQLILSGESFVMSLIAACSSSAPHARHENDDENDDERGGPNASTPPASNAIELLGRCRRRQRARQSLDVHTGRGIVSPAEEGSSDDDTDSDLP